MAAARRDIAPFLQRVRAFLLGVSSWQCCSAVGN